MSDSNNNDIFKYVILGLLICAALIIGIKPYIFPGNFDEHTSSLVIMEFEHSRIHDGYGFQYSRELTALTTGSVTYLLMNTTTSGIHWRDYSISCDSAPILIEMYESPTVTSYGTLQNTTNRNRFSSINSTTNIYVGAVIANDGTRLIVDEILGNKHSAGPSGAFSLEWILKSSTTYIVKITNNNGNNVDCISKAFWYELD